MIVKTTLIYLMTLPFKIYMILHFRNMNQLAMSFIMYNVIRVYHDILNKILLIWVRLIFQSARSCSQIMTQLLIEYSQP